MQDIALSGSPGGEMVESVLKLSDLTEAKAMQAMDKLLAFGEKEEWSDMDIVSGYPPFAHKPTGVEPLTVSAPLDENNVYSVIKALWASRRPGCRPLQGLPELGKWTTEVVDFTSALPSVRTRVHGYRCSTGVGASLRILPSRAKRLEDLGLPPDVVNSMKNVLRRRNGFGLVTGPMGSGKSTTLAAAVAYCLEMGKKVVTLEDPIEFIYEDMGIVPIVQKELGDHFETYAKGLKAALRERADVILAQEIRDRECAEVAMEAAQTGVFVLGTTHARGVSGTFTRFCEMYEEREWPSALGQLSSSLSFVSSQGLLPRADGKGRQLIAGYFQPNQDMRLAIRRFHLQPADLKEHLNKPGQFPFSNSLRSAKIARVISDETAREWEHQED